MDRFVVYTDISLGYVVYDTLNETVVVVFRHYDRAERAAARMNGGPRHTGPRSRRALARTVTAPTPRYVVRPGFHNLECVVVARWTLEIVWGPRPDIRAADAVAAKYSDEPLIRGLTAFGEGAHTAGGRS